MRNIPDSAFGVGTHKIAFGNKPSDDIKACPIRHRQYNNQCAVKLIRTSRELGMTTVDTAPLYRAGKFVGHAFDELGLTEEQRIVYTKCLRFLVPLGKRTERQPPFYVENMAPPFRGLTDEFLFTAKAIEAQVAEERERLNTTKITGVGWHDLGDYIGFQVFGLSDIRGLDAALQTRAGEIDWTILEKETMPTLVELKDSGEIEEIGFCTKNWQITRLAFERFQFDYVMSTFCNPLMSTDCFDLLEACRESGTKIAHGGLFFGAALVQNDPTKLKPGAIEYNYEPITAEEIGYLIRFWNILNRHGKSLKEMAAAFCGRMVEKYPDVFNRIVTSTRDPRRLGQTKDLILTADLPQECWRELIEAGLIDRRCEAFLID